MKIHICLSALILLSTFLYVNNKSTVVKELDQEVIEFRKKINNYNLSKLVDIFVTTKSCDTSSNPYNEILLEVHSSATLLTLIHDTKESVNRFYERRAEFKKLWDEIAQLEEESIQESKRLKDAQKKYSKLKTCDTNINYLSQQNKTWTEYFREKYEYLPQFKKVEHKKEILVAVIDSGVNFLDPILSNAIPEQYKQDIKKLNFSNGVDFDANGHGTHVAGIILGVMPDAKILPLKSLVNGRKSLDATIKALKYAVEQNVDIINYSAGGLEFNQEEYNILKKAQKKGILVIAAAGNESSNIDDEKTTFYPASYKLDNIIAIGNSKTNWFKESNGFEKEPSSNYGRKNVDFFLKGKNVKSLSTNVDKCGLEYLTGTSMSTPVFTGIIASLKAQYPELSNKEILKHLSTLAHPVDTNSRYGYLELSTALNTPIETTIRELASNKPE